MDLRSRRVPSAAIDDSASIRSRAYNSGSSHRLRPAESRYSLREQFAVTRREIEFGFDDASSMREPSLWASEAIQTDELDDVVVPGAETLPPFPGSDPISRSCYELLCLPREPTLSPEEVHHAAHRLIQVLAVDKQPPRLQGSAAFYLGLAQAAFENLVDPARRLGYDLSGGDETADSDCEGAAIGNNDTGLGTSDTYGSRVQEQYLLLTQRDARATTDVGLRVDAASLLTSPPRQSRRNAPNLDILDFSIRKSATVPVPALRAPIERILLAVQELANKSAPDAQSKPRLRLTDPTLTISGSTHGLLDEPYKLAPLLLDRYQPPGPSIHRQRRMEQLLASRFLPALNLNLRQELFWRPDSRGRALPDLVVEQELDLLPQPCAALRVGHSFNLPSASEPLSFEIYAQRQLKPRRDLTPHLGLAVHKAIGPGTGFIVADSGDWSLWTSKECRELSKFSKVSRGFIPIIDTLQTPPTVEAGYAFGRHDLGVQSGQSFTKPSERGLTAVDCDMDEGKAGSWTISTALTRGNAAAYLRYGKDFFSSLSPKRNSSRPKHGIRGEVELAGSAQRDFFLAFRVLKRIGRFSKAGFEVGISPTNLHLSLYFSRLGQRFSLPFLAATKARFTTRLLFWTTVFPFAALAAWELYRQQKRLQAAVAGINALAATLTSSGSSSSRREAQLQSYIAHRRAEADELTVVLATGVEPRQNAERQRGGLVIISGKYGVRDAPPDEVADVTIALAALVDEAGRLVIPGGLRKSRLLGFWDPAPLKEKVLRVRYLWQGKELAVEVSGREELRLP